MENFTALFTPKSTSFSRLPSAQLIGSKLFDFYYQVRDLQEKYLSYIEEEDFYASVMSLQNHNENSLKQMFNVYHWFQPCFHHWLSASESKTMEWVQSAVQLDKFEPINPQSNILNSTSVIDLFFCFNQILDVLMPLEWQIEGEVEGELQIQRQLQWYSLMTRFARILQRVLGRYAELLTKSVVEERLKFLKEQNQKQDQNFLSLKSSTKNLSQMEWLSCSKNTEMVCVKVNNLEEARLKLNEIYDRLKVAEISEFTQKHRPAVNKKDVLPEAPDSLSGYVSMKIVSAENLIACDANGASDPYCLIQAHQKQPPPAAVSTLMSPLSQPQSPVDGLYARELAKTKVIYHCLNPKWDEYFTFVLRQCHALSITVYDYDLIGKDDVCGEAKVELQNMEKLKKLLKDGQMHELWLDLKPQGKILLRLQLEGQEPDSDPSKQMQLADIEFYFRKGFRELKRNTNDLLGVMAESMTSTMQKEIISILNDCRDKQKNWINKVFNAKQEGQVAKAEHVTAEEVDLALSTLTQYLNQTLSTLSSNLNPRVSKELLKRTWKELLNTLDQLLLPSLYGELKPKYGQQELLLTQRQVSMMIGCLEVLKDFFYADGSELGLSKEILESKKYLELKDVLNNYCIGEQELKNKYEEKQDDMLLRLIRVRMMQHKEYFELKMKEREKRLSWDTFTTD